MNGYLWGLAITGAVMAAAAPPTGWREWVALTVCAIGWPLAMTYVLIYCYRTRGQ